MRVLCLVFFMSSTAFAMEGMYYCQGTAAGGIQNGSGTAIRESKFTVKVKSGDYQTVVSGDFGTANLNPESINEKNGWVYATAGVHNALTLKRQGSVYGFTLYLSDLAQQSSEISSNPLFNVVASWECAETVGLFDPSWHSKEKTWIGV